MRIFVLFICFLLSFPLCSWGEKVAIEFVATKKMVKGNMFLYRCRETGNVFEIEQRYNPHSRSEEIRFVTNGTYGEWVTQGVSPDIFKYFTKGVCIKSRTRYVQLKR